MSLQTRRGGNVSWDLLDWFFGQGTNGTLPQT
jgi:hypothetical protein